MTTRQRYLAEQNNTLEAEYGALVSRLIRKKYSQQDIEAIINNYLANPENEKYRKEFLDLQEYRALCKEQAKSTLHI